jgi:hypothetical protein
MPLGEHMNRNPKTLILFGVLSLLLVYLGGCSSQQDSGADNTITTTIALSVDDAVRNLKSDTTTQTVIGVVQTITPKDNLLTLIDVEEYKICGLSDCCLYMPVRWQGEMPNIEDIVTVTGIIDSIESGLVFTAGELHVNKKPAVQ